MRHAVMHEKPVYQFPRPPHLASSVKRAPSIHEACALTTEAAIANYIYRGEVVRRQTGRHHAAGPTPRTQFRAKDGTYVCALVAGRLNPRSFRGFPALLASGGMAGDFRAPKSQDPASSPR